jgi:RNA polymerase sigma-70 factor (ECF subfamily)
MSHVFLPNITSHSFLQFKNRINLHELMRNKIENIIQQEDGLLSQTDNFSFFFIEWHPSLVYFIFKIVKEQAVAEDIAEDAFVVLWEKRNNFKNIKVAQAFLYSTARNASLNWLRYQKSSEKKTNALRDIADNKDRYILEEIIHAEFIHELYTALNYLPAQCRKIFDMLYVEGKNNKEIAEELRLSINTIKAQRARGLSILRKKLAFVIIIFFSLV